MWTHILRMSYLSLNSIFCTRRTRTMAVLDKHKWTRPVLIVLCAVMGTVLLFPFIDSGFYQPQQSQISLAPANAIDAAKISIFLWLCMLPISLFTLVLSVTLLFSKDSTKKDFTLGLIGLCICLTPVLAILPTAIIESVF